MSHEDFDKEIASLYQQRKQQVAAPEVQILSEKPAKQARYNLWQMLSILFFSGVASFGILAIISHFSAKPVLKQVTSTVTKVRVVDIEDQHVASSDDAIALILPPLTPKKPYVAPLKSRHELAVKIEVLPKDLALSLPIDVVKVVASPNVVQPTLSLVPIYQEQPKYSIKAIRAQQSGKVTLAYNISLRGKVTNITLIESSANRELTNAAKKALSNWRYQPGEFNEEGYEIIFDFILNAKN